MMKPYRIPFLFFAIFATSLHANDEPFAIQGEQMLTQGELDAAFAEIPEQHRYAFIRDGERVDQPVQKLLRARQIAAAARAEGFDEEPLIADRLELKQEEALATIWLEHIVANAPDADYEAMAEEYYLANPDEFLTEERIDVSHLLISTESRSEEKALERVTDLQTRLAEDPASLDALIMEFSEDPAKASNQGRYPQMRRGEMVKPFEEAAFALEEPGQISAPVETSYGYHIIRLNRKFPRETLPYETVKQQLIEGVERKYRADYRSRYIVDVTTGQIELPEGAVEAMLKRHFGENLENAPTFRD